MSTIQNALARVVRVVRGPGRPPEKPWHSYSDGQLPPVRPRPLLPPPDVARLRPHLKGFQKTRFQHFLAPLNMPRLKMFEGDVEPYDARRAQANLAAKKSADHVAMFGYFLEERHAFVRMLDLLVELTPDRLKDPQAIQDPAALHATLDAEEQAYRATQYPTPRYHFLEVPPMPQPLTQKTFHEYIHYLTHTKVLFRNSLSTSSGVVPELLLHTHSLDNAEFAHLRTTETYNCLIKFFGYDKFQSSFARALLLVMAKDGHKPNINTIHMLLKVCRSHTQRRSLASTYNIVTRYLGIVKKLELSVGLTTWNRVYDCIDNIFLKELFLERMLAISLPVTDNLCLQILQDYCKTTPESAAVVAFVELDLRRPNWRADPRYVGKVLYHQIVNYASEAELASLGPFLDSAAVDALTSKVVSNAIAANTRFANKPWLLLGAYVHMGARVEPTPEVFGKLITALVESDYAVPCVASTVRGLIHDAITAFSIPVETFHHESRQNRKGSDVKAEFIPKPALSDPALPKPTTSKSTLAKPESAFKTKAPSGQSQPKAAFPYRIPRHPTGEHYRIMKRLVRNLLTDLEAAVIHHNAETGAHVRMPWAPLRDNELAQWNQTKADILATPDYYAQDPARFGLGPRTAPKIPASVLAAYRRWNHHHMSVRHDARVVEQLQQGFAPHLLQELRERRIVTGDWLSYVQVDCT